MRTLYALARAGANLAPWERALLKLVEGWVLAGFISALVVFFTAVSQAHPDYGSALKIAAGVFVTATCFAALKYVKAHLDSPLGDSLPPSALKGLSDLGNKPAT